MVLAGIVAVALIAILFKLLTVKSTRVIINLIYPI